MQVFFDLDPVVYMSGFAAQYSVYSTVWEHPKQGMQETFHKDGIEARRFRAENAELIVREDKDIVVHPESFARQCAKTLINSSLRAIKARFKVDKLEPGFFLTGKGNFREELATVAEYKGNRKEVAKPVHYDTVREFLISHYGAYVIDGQEADDEVSIRAWELYTNTDRLFVVASVDKDLDQIPGWHYDYKKKVFYHVAQEDANSFFYAQVLAGDATDNIKGCYRIGLAKALALVNGWIDDYYMRDGFERPSSGHDAYVWQQIVATYEANRERYPDKHPEGISAEEEALENARLVYMRRRRHEIWQPET